MMMFNLRKYLMAALALSMTACGDTEKTSDGFKYQVVNCALTDNSVRSEPTDQYVGVEFSGFSQEIPQVQFSTSPKWGAQEPQGSPRPTNIWCGGAHDGFWYFQYRPEVVLTPPDTSIKKNIRQQNPDLDMSHYDYFVEIGAERIVGRWGARVKCAPVSDNTPWQTTACPQ